MIIAFFDTRGFEKSVFQIFSNVLMHQTFTTDEALENIDIMTLQNITDFENGNNLKNEVFTEKHKVN